jgi:hypothetical protein
MPKETKEKKEQKPRSANRKLQELTLNEQRVKLILKLAKYRGLVSRNKARYEAITPHKISKNKDLEKSKADYKKAYEKAEPKRVEVSTMLKEVDRLLKEVKQLKAEGKDTSHLNIKTEKKKGRPNKKEGAITYKTVVTPGTPLEKKDFIEGEWMQSMKMKWAIEKLQKQNKQVDDIMEKAKREGTDVHGIDEEEYDRINKEIKKLTKERDAFIYKIRKRVGKEDIVTKIPTETKDVQDKRAKGRPKKDKPVVEKKPKGRPRKEKVEVEKKPKGRPKKEKKEPTKPKKQTYLSFVKANWERLGLPNYKSAVTDTKMKDAYKQRNNVVEVVSENKHIAVDEVDVKQIAKEVVSKKLESIVDEVVKEVAPKKEKKVKFVKVVEDVKGPEVINTNNEIVPFADVMPHKEILEYLFDTFGSLTKKMSKRFEQKITPLPQSSKQALHDQLSYKRNANDFHPTPQKCLNEHVHIRVDENTNILEPSTGFGSVLYYLLDKYPSVKITAYEMFEHIYAFLKNEYPTVNTIRMNFLESNPKNNTYDIIICNPPFTVGSYDSVKKKTGYDSRFYYNFLFKCFEYMYYSKTKTYECGLIFISPALFEEDTEGKTGIRDTGSLINLSPNKKMQILKQSTYFSGGFNKTNINDMFDEYMSDVQPTQIQCLGKCEFQTTKSGVYFYHCIFINQYRYKEKEEPRKRKKEPIKTT